MGGESQNVNLSLVADNTMLHRSLEVLDLENHMEPAEAATALNAIFTDCASVSIANEDYEQLPNTLKESLAAIEVEVEHAANLEHSKSGCLVAVCEKLQKAAVEGVPARGDVHQQSRRALSLKGEYEQCESRQAKDLISKRVKVLQGQSRRETTQKQPHVFAASVWSWSLHFSGGTSFRCNSSFCTSRMALMRL